MNTLVKKFLAVTTLVLLAACTYNELPDLSGRYMGRQYTPTEEKLITTSIPQYEEKEADGVRSQEISFSFQELLSSALPVPMKIQFMGLSNLYVTSPLLKTAGLAVEDDTSVHLIRHGGCNDTVIEKRRLEICWTGRLLELRVYDTDSEIPNPKSIIFGLHLARDDKLPDFTSTQRELTLNLDQVLGRARLATYKEAQDAELLYQARNNITIARRNLLPKISARSVLNIVLGGSPYEAISSALPFVFPTQWYRLKEAHYNYNATRYSYSALCNNEMNMAESLYLTIDRDHAVHKAMDRYTQFLSDAVTSIQEQRTLGLVTEQEVREVIALASREQKDQSVLNTLLIEEMAQLNKSLAVSPFHGINGLTPLTLVDPETAQPLTALNIYTAVEMASLEAASLKHLIRAAHENVKALTFSWITPSDVIIDLSLPAAVRNAMSTMRIAESRLDETYALLEVKTISYVAELNQRISDASLIRDGLTRHNDSLQELTDHQKYSTTDVKQLIEARKLVFESEVEQISNNYGYANLRSNLNRILLQGPYRDLLDSEIPFHDDKSL